MERTLHKVQKILGAAVEPMIHMVDGIGANRAKPMGEYLNRLKDPMNLICADISYLS